MSFNTVKSIPKEYIDLSYNRTLPVIASFNVRGDCVPVYFRYTFADGTYTDIAIDRVSIMDKRFRQTIYECIITANDIRQKVTLTYFREDGLWVLKTN